MEKEKKRRLSDKERKRKEEFDLICEQMEAKGYQKKELLCLDHPTMAGLVVFEK